MKTEEQMKEAEQEFNKLNEEVGKLVDVYLFRNVDNKDNLSEEDASVDLMSRMGMAAGMYYSGLKKMRHIIRETLGEKAEATLIKMMEENL